MHNRALHDTLAAFVEEAAWQLAAEVSGGAEIPFDLIEQGRSTAPLYCYRPQTSAFIAERAGALAKLPSWPAAVSQLRGLAGAEAYLKARGHRAHGAEAALHAFLTAVWADATDFVYDEARFEAAYAELETAAYAECSLTHVVAPLDGLLLESALVELGAGLSLQRAASVRDAPDELRSQPDATLVVLRAESRHGEPPALEAAGRRLRRLQTALRLWDDAEPAVGPAAWARSEGGTWLCVPLAGGMRRLDDDCLLEAEEEDPLRAFCALVDRRTPRAGELAWALRRFELGCERPNVLDALTDWLLAVRALLAEPGEPGYEHVPERLAAICARPEEREELIDRATRVIALERASIAGLVRPEPAVASLVEELGRQLRAVLRDVLCGHLDPDLRRVADALVQAGTVSSNK